MQEAVKRKLIEDPVRKALIAFTLPLLLSNLFQQLYNTVDTVIVGHFIPQALASVSTSVHLIFLLIGFFNGMSVGAGVVISKFFGEKKYEDIDKIDESDPEPTGGCYIATSVYGSYDCPEVWTLRRFRDNVLAKTWYGRAFVKTYYAVSPTLVEWFGETNWFQNLWRAVLDVFVDILNEFGFENTPYHDQKW